MRKDLPSCHDDANDRQVSLWRKGCGGRTMAQESRGFVDADASLSGFGIGTNGTDRTNKPKNKARFRVCCKGFGGRK